MCLLLTLLAVPVFYSLFDDAVTSPAWARFATRFRRRPLVPVKHAVEP
jgi:hypothetical protein